MLKLMGLLIMLLALVGCTPATSIKAPLSARPLPANTAANYGNGAIFQSGISQPLFEDRRARQVGDVLTVTIAEVTTATEKSSSNGSSAGSVDVTFPGLPQRTGWSATAGVNAVKSGSSSDNSGNNVFNGTITVTVVEVLKNGNLLVTGEKLVTVKFANEYVRFSGVVNPKNLDTNNSVLSTQVADVQIEYKNANNIDMASISTMFSRFFLSILPF